MILVVVKQPVRPKYSDQWPQLVAELAAATRAEPGCLSYDWCRSADDPNLWVLIETYRDAEAGDAHVQSEHFKKATQEMPKWLAAAPEIIHVEVPGDEWSAVSEGA